jgi:hypothetical protein
VAFDGNHMTMLNSKLAADICAPVQDFPGWMQGVDSYLSGKLKISSFSKDVQLQFCSRWTIGFSDDWNNVDLNKNLDAAYLIEIYISRRAPFITFTAFNVDTSNSPVLIHGAKPYRRYHWINSGEASSKAFGLAKELTNQFSLTLISVEDARKIEVPAEFLAADAALLEYAEPSVLNLLFTEHL